MVKILPIFLAAFAASNVADAATCTAGLKYCGKALIRFGGFGRTLNSNSLYVCNENGSASLVKYCPLFCTERGVGEDDTC
ncbi:hypothetical protein E4U19_004099 [Claviceps sp. Clav32 group G5]|nr:hypothetical protein E4U19_004099 [Claviceps sp. Clav32 group G5]KAG6043841.1 hypothetical protein E4U39_004057 [Claviceps sp. Clav50 group G5]